jgi:hypothetical protein
MTTAFVAYDKVLFPQYGFYQEYALLVPGVDTYRLALNILGLSQGDIVVQDFRDALRTELVKNEYVADEYHLYAIRNRTGVLFDIYLVNEDNQFQGCAAGVVEEEVVPAGVALLQSVAGREAFNKMWNITHN